MHPLLFDAIPLYFVMWGCAAVVGVVVGTAVAARAGFPAPRAAVAIALLAVSILVGSKLFYLAEAHWFPFDDYVPAELRGPLHGFRIPGGMLLLAAVMPLVCRGLRLPWGRFGDTAIPTAALPFEFVGSCREPWWAGLLGDEGWRFPGAGSDSRAFIDSGRSQWKPLKGRGGEP